MKRAEGFLQVTGSRENLSRANFKAALCLRMDAYAKWAKNPKDPEALAGIQRAESTLVRVLATRFAGVYGFG